MLMEIGKVQAETLRLALNIAPDYKWALSHRPDLVEQVANGVGSETSISYHVTPDTVWGLNINPGSHCHDWMYTFPMYFPSVADGLAWKQLSDHWFDLNVDLQIKDYAGWFESFRYRRNNIYEMCLAGAGSDAFWIDKQLPPDFEIYYSDRPECDPEKMELYRSIEYQISNKIEETD